MKWTEKQQQVIDARGCNLLVSAAAGSGKTAVLVERIIQLICDEEHPVDIDRLLVMTFTNAAAAEMRERISQTIEKKLAQYPDREHLQIQAALVHRAQITTIDSFCLSLIRDHFNLLDMDPGFRIGDEGELMLLRADVMEQLLEDYYESGDPVFSRFVETYATGKSDSGIEDYIMQVYTFSQSNPFPEEWFAQCRRELEETETGNLEKTSWVAYLLEDAGRQALELADQLRGAIEICGLEGGPEVYIPTLTAELQMVEALGAAEDYDTLQQRLCQASFGRIPAARGKNLDPEKKEYASECRSRVKKAVGTLKSLYGQQNREEAAESILGSRDVTLKLLELAEEFHRRYQESKRDKNIVDFNDLEHEALNILVKKEDGILSCTPVADELSQRYAEILVDEYQDSNDVQETLINSLSAERFGRPNVFMVGDVKQSIYKFRLARPELFMKKYGLFGEDKEENGGRKIELRQNFRSRASVLDSINQVFFQIMTENLGNISYTDQVALHPGAVFQETDKRAGTPTELLLVDTGTKVVGPADEELEEYTSREMEARLIASRIRQLTDPEEGTWVWDKEAGAYRPAEYGDMVILLRSLTGWTDSFLNVLTQEGIPALAETGTGYFNTVEVETVLAMLAVIDNPMQDIPLAAVLKSPMVGMDEEELAWLMAAAKKYPVKGQDRGVYGAVRLMFRDPGQNLDGKEQWEERDENSPGSVKEWEDQEENGEKKDKKWELIDKIALEFDGKWEEMEEEIPKSGGNQEKVGEQPTKSDTRQEEMGERLWNPGRKWEKEEIKPCESDKKWEEEKEKPEEIDIKWGKIETFAENERKWREIASLAGAPEEVIQRIYDKVTGFFALLGQLRREAAYLPIHELIHRMYLRTGYYDYVSAMPAGEARKANLDMLIEKASAYEKTSYKGLFHFIRYIERLKKYDTDFGEATAAGKSRQMVRIMSIHKSKGLEFPIVFLAGMGKAFNRQDVRGKLLIDADLGIGTDYLDVETRVKTATLKKQVLKRKMDLDNLGEELRVLYVAMTRAKEKLIMTATDRSLEKKLDKWKQKTWDSEQIPYTILSSAGSCLDWILMARPETSPLFCVRQIPVESLVGEAVAGKVRKTVSEEELRTLDLTVTYDQDTEDMLKRQLSYEYPYKADINLHTKVSVSELKKQGQDIDDKNSLFQPLIPEFLKEDRRRAREEGLKEEESQSPEEGLTDQEGEETRENQAVRKETAQEDGAAGRQSECQEILADGENQPVETSDQEKQQEPEEAQTAGKKEGAEKEGAEKEGAEKEGTEKEASEESATKKDPGTVAPGGAVRGSAYHRVLELLDFTAVNSRDDVRQWLEKAGQEGRITGDTVSMVRPEKIWRFLQSSLGRRMRQAQQQNRLYREQQFVMGVPAEEMNLGDSRELVLIQGIIDAWIEEDDGLVLIDYKTDHIGRGQEEILVKRYQIQLDYYKRALEQIRKKQVKERIIYSLSLQKEIAL